MAETDLITLPRATVQQALEALEEVQNHMNTSDWFDMRATALKAALEQPEHEPLTDTYVQEVPDKCDRIVWRGYYFCLPVNSTSKPEQGPVAWSDARLRGIASDYFPEAKDWPAAMLCLRHLLMEQAKYPPASAPQQAVPYAVWRQGFDAVRKYKQQPQQAGPVEIKPPNPEGATLCTVRWWAETPAGWVGAWDREALEHFAHPPRRDPLTVTDLQKALVDADLVDQDALFDPDGYDNGVTLERIDALHEILRRKST